MIDGGPFRWVRHPRYAGLLLSRLAFVLIFASAIGWALLVVWFAVILRRIRLEEAHLGRSFGDAWTRYAEGRASDLPPGRPLFARVIRMNCEDSHAIPSLRPCSNTLTPATPGELPPLTRPAPVILAPLAAFIGIALRDTKC